MNWGLFAAAGAFFLLVLIRFLLRCNRPFRGALGGVLLGEAALFAVHLLGLALGFSLPLSVLSVGAAGVLGIPGVTAMLILNLIL